MRKTAFLLAAALSAVIFLFSCSARPDETKIEIKTIQYEPDGDNFLKFYCNDRQYHGWAYWHYWPGTNLNQSGTIIEAQMKKISGCRNCGYGVVFCHTNHNDTNYCYYRVLVTVDGWYTMQIITNDAWAPLIDWTSNSAIAQGYNQINTIKVSNNYSAGRYCLYINGIYAGYTACTNLTGGSDCGIITFVGSESEENFPNVPVDCRFKILFGAN